MVAVNRDTGSRVQYVPQARRDLLGAITGPVHPTFEPRDGKQPGPGTWDVAVQLALGDKPVGEVQLESVMINGPALRNAGPDPALIPGIGF